MNFSTKIEALIVEIEKELGIDRGFPVTIELAKAALEARKLEAQVPACGIDCEGFHGCARGYKSTDACFAAGRKWPVAFDIANCLECGAFREHGHECKRQIAGSGK